MGVLQVRRAHRNADTVLLTTGLALGMEGRELADLYFARWPIQENAFKEGSAIGLQQHRGNCGRMVANVAVITELERLESRAKVEAAEQLHLVETKPALEEQHRLAEREHKRAVAALATRRGRLDALVTKGRRDGKQLGAAAIEHQEAMVRAEAAEIARTATKESLARSDARAAALETNRAALAARCEKLGHQRTIRQLDVALDSVLTAAKPTCARALALQTRPRNPAAAIFKSRKRDHSSLRIRSRPRGSLRCPRRGRPPEEGPRALPNSLAS